MTPRALPFAAKMFSNARRWCFVIGSTVLPLLAAGWAYVLKTSQGDGAIGAKIAMLCAIGLVAFELAYISIIKPVRDIRTFARFALGFFGATVLSLGDSDDIEPRVNILMIRRCWYWPFKKRFHLVWHLRMEGHTDRNVCFDIQKGVAGLVLRDQKPSLVDFGQPGVTHTQFGFTREEVGKFGFSQTAIHSWPIYELDSNDNQTERILGTVNLDALRPGAGGKIAARQAEYDKVLGFLSEVVSKLSS